MKVIIKTAIKSVKNIIDVLKKDNNFEVVGITDNNVEKWDTIMNDARVLSPFRCIELYQNGEMDAVLIPAALGYNKIRAIERELTSFGYRKEDIYVAEIKVDSLGGAEECKLIKVDEYVALDYLEFHVSHKCNLNCKACCHFSSITTRDFPDYDEWHEGIRQLKKRIPHINDIHLLGGEPLLNPELKQYVIQTRELYPESKMEIISNGILVRQMSMELIECLRENNVKIGITVYPAMYKKMEETLKYLKEIDLLGGVGYAFEFSKMISREKRKFPYVSTEKICHCPNLVGTNLVPCPLIAYIEDFNNAFQEEFEYEDGFVSLLDEAMTGKQLLEALYSPKKLCDYCRSYMTEGSIRGMNDWSDKWAAYSKENAPQSKDWLLDT